MAVVGGSLQATVVFPTISSGNVQNVAITLANTEYTVTIPSGTKKFSMRLRPSGAAILKIAFLVGQSGIEYHSIMPGGFIELEDVGASFVIYVQATLPTQVVELLTWS